MAPRKTREVGIRLSVRDKEVVERALKGIGTDGEAALKRIQHAAGPASTSLTALNRASAGARSTLVGLAGGIAAGLLPVLSFAAAINGAKQAMTEFGEIADRSKSAGLDAEYYQGLAHAAKLAGVDIGELSNALDTFYKNAELAEKGKGKLYSQLKAINPELLKTLQLADSQEERLAAVADALEKSADKAGLAGAIFGDVGPRIAAAFEGGSHALDASIVKARELGLIVDRELIASADALGDEFDTTTKIVDLQLKKALIDLGPVIVWLAGLAGGLAEQIGGAVDNLKPLADQRRSTIEGTYEGIDLRLNDVNPAMSAGITKEEADKLKAPLLAELRRRAMDDLRRQLTALTPPEGGGGSLPPDEEAAKIAERRAEAIRKVTTNLGQQIAALAMTNREQAIQNALSQAQVTLADQEGKAIADLAGKYYDQKAAIDAANESASFFAHTIADAFESFLDDGKLAVDEIDNITSALRRAVLQAALLGEGPLAGLAGTKSETGGTGGILGALAGGLVGLLTKKPTAGWGNGWAAMRNANGNVFGGPSHLSSFANSIVRSRTPFYAAKGLGIMGEAGKSPGEAILPLLRDARGRLGVANAGGSTEGQAVNVQLIVERRQGAGQDNAVSEVHGRQVVVRATVWDVAAEGIRTPGSPIDKALRSRFKLTPALAGN